LLLLRPYLEEGYSFNAIVDGRTFRVKVPERGVQADEEFVVHHPQEIVWAKGTSIQGTAAPRGRWRKCIFSCFDTACTGAFWMGFLCPVIQTAQLQTGFNLGWLSETEVSPEVARRTFAMSIIVFLAFWTFIGWLPELFAVYVVFYLFVQARLRRNARLRYDIPGNAFMDLIYTLFCGWCSTIQMVRHTHDEKVFPYDACAIDGLSIDAPPLACLGTNDVESPAPTSQTNEVTEVTV
jgi:Cys-rich protein (TIGR01571 family)